MLINKGNVKEKKWVVKASQDREDNPVVLKIAKELKINKILAQLLYSRGYTTVKSANEFIKMEREMLRNPFDMKDIDKGIERIRLAIENKEKITVYGDYDVDGVTSVCTLYLYLQSQGADVEYYIPNRSGDGYGVSVSAIDMIKEKGSSLIITVDTGVTASDEVEYARSIGVDFLITDHHECLDTLPNAAAVINPHRNDCNYPFKELAGVGVVFKLVCAYEEKYNTKDRLAAALKIIKEYADLVAIGTIADVMPIKEENRIIVKYGLSMIENTERLGLAALIEAASSRNDNKKTDTRQKAYKKRKSKITSSFIGFTLAPRINAAGRVRSASIAVELFLATKYDKALKIAEELCEANRERQAEENKIMTEAYARIEELGIVNDPVIVLDADDWHHGVIGIVSSRITEKFCRPSILISFEGNDNDNKSGDDVGKGSGRSVKGLNLVEALYNCSECLVKFGGHELAAGLSVTRAELPEFRRRINDYARKILNGKELVPTIEADLEIKFSDIDLPLAEELRLLEPYGVENPVPVFVMNSVSISEINGISDGKHTRIVFSEGSKTLSCMYFSNSPESIGLSVGEKADVLFSIDINEWLDRKNVQLVAKDIKRSLTEEVKHSIDRERFEEIRKGAEFSLSEDVLPERNDFVTMYRFIQNSLHNGLDTFSHSDLVSKLSSISPNYKFNYIKLKFIIMVFREMNLVDIDEISEETYRFKIHYSTTKKNLEKSHILRKLRMQLR